MNICDNPVTIIANHDETIFPHWVISWERRKVVSLAELRNWQETPVGALREELKYHFNIICLSKFPHVSEGDTRIHLVEGGEAVVVCQYWRIGNVLIPTREQPVVHFNCERGPLVETTTGLDGQVEVIVFAPRYRRVPPRWELHTDLLTAKGRENRDRGLPLVGQLGEIPWPDAVIV